jgi:hypothetical protein
MPPLMLFSSIISPFSAAMIATPLSAITSASMAMRIAHGGASMRDTAADAAFQRRHFRRLFFAAATPICRCQPPR